MSVLKKLGLPNGHSKHKDRNDAVVRWWGLIHVSRHPVGNLLHPVNRSGTNWLLFYQKPTAAVLHKSKLIDSMSLNTTSHLTPSQFAKERVNLQQIAQSPEFIDSKGLRAIFGISRSHAYRLADEGLIKSSSLRPKGAIKGKRLWVVESVRNYLNSCIAASN